MHGDSIAVLPPKPALMVKSWDWAFTYLVCGVPDKQSPSVDPLPYYALFECDQNGLVTSVVQVFDAEFGA